MGCYGIAGAKRDVRCGIRIRDEGLIETTGLAECEDKLEPEVLEMQSGKMRKQGLSGKRHTGHASSASSDSSRAANSGWLSPSVLRTYSLFSLARRAAGEPATRAA